MVTNSAYAVLGVAPLLGRVPDDMEDVPGGSLVAVLSHGLWVERFASDPDVIGATIEVDDRAREVIGVMPPDFTFPSSDVDLWIPLQLDPSSQLVGLLRYRVIARLDDGVTMEAATADAESLFRRLGEAGFGPEWFEGTFRGRAHVQTFKELIVGDTRATLLIILGAVSFVLLIASANVANLILVRSDDRMRHTTIRAALGATRRRLAQYVLTESMLLALMGGVGGIVLAYLGIRLLVTLGPASIPRLDEVELSTTTLAYTFGISAIVGLLFGIVPALQAGSVMKSSRGRSLVDGARGSTVGGDRLRLRGVLVVTEVALASALLVASGLMVRTFGELRAVDPGFDPEGVITFTLTPPVTRYPDTEATAQLFDQMLERIRALPGVESAGATMVLPLRPGPGYTVTVEDHPTPEGDFPPVHGHRWVTPGYLETMRIPVVAGRTMEPADHQQELRTLFVSQSIADLYWPDGAIGKRIAIFGRAGTVVGVVGDIRYRGLDAPDADIIYLPMDWPRTATWRGMSVAVRASGGPAALVPTLRREVAAIDPGLPLSDIQTMEDVVSESMSGTTFTMSLLVLASFVAVFLGSVGIYGVISYVVRQRTAEIGVRMALGADAADTRLRVLRLGMAPAVIGIVVGLTSAALLNRTLESLLFEVGVFDPLTFVAAPILFLVIAALACVIPARRATKIDPAEALRG
jgi:putative ABC transport system permease protein